MIHAGKFHIEKHASGALIAYEGGHTGISLTGNAVAQAMYAKIVELREALALVLPYAESRAEDLDELRAQEDPGYPGADAAIEAVNKAAALLGEDCE